MKKSSLTFLLILVLVFLGVVTPLVILEVALRMGFRHNDLNWTPPEATLADDLLSQHHYVTSKLHPYGFNDTVTSSEKAPGVFRIVILGDSVVWGDGLPEEQRWNRKLEERIKKEGKNIQVLHWGIGGWSTQDQVNFLKAHGADWNIDYLIISYFSNDPDVKLVPQKHFQWNEYSFPRFLATTFPYAARFIFGYLSQLLNEQVPGWGYDYWENKLYSKENLEVYTTVVQNLRTVTNQLGIPTTVILVPTSWHPYFKEQFDKVVPIFEAAGFPVYNLYPEIQSRLSNIPLPDLRANRADGHPGSLMTEAYADLVYNKLRSLYKAASNHEMP